MKISVEIKNVLATLPPMKSKDLKDPPTIIERFTAERARLMHWTMEMSALFLSLVVVGEQQYKEAKITKFGTLMKRFVQASALY